MDVVRAAHKAVLECRSFLVHLGAYGDGQKTFILSLFVNFSNQLDVSETLTLAPLKRWYVFGFTSQRIGVLDHKTLQEVLERKQSLEVGKPKSDSPAE